MTAALIGGTAVIIAAIFTLAAALMGTRAPAHTADVTGLAALADARLDEINNLRAQLRECRAECERLRHA